jgi:hypothetical protein
MVAVSPISRWTINVLQAFSSARGCDELQKHLRVMPDDEGASTPPIRRH